MANDETSKAEADAPDSASRSRTRTERKFPVLTFEDTLPLADAIQKFAAGQKVRRLTLFEKLQKSPDSGTTKRLITSSGQYGLTKGSYSAEFLDLTPEGGKATGDEVPAGAKLRARFDLAIGKIVPFKHLYELLKGISFPLKRSWQTI